MAVAKKNLYRYTNEKKKRITAYKYTKFKNSQRWWEKQKEKKKNYKTENNEKNSDSKFLNDNN